MVAAAGSVSGELRALATRRTVFVSGETESVFSLTEFLLSFSFAASSKPDAKVVELNGKFSQTTEVSGLCLCRDKSEGF